MSFSEEENKSIPVGDVIEKTLAKTKEAKRRKKLRNEITHKKRFEILERDGHKCQYCGVTPNDGIKLVVDHIIPLDKGGTNDDSNLITACWECNEGKKNTLLKRYDLKRKYDLPEGVIGQVKDLVGNNDFEKWKEFWLEDKNSEVRELMYDINELVPGQTCINDCKECIKSGLWYFKGCLQILDGFFNTKDPMHNTDPNLFIGLSRSIKVDVTKDESTTLRCSFCYLSRRCPAFSNNSTCKYDFLSNVFDDPEENMKALIKIQNERVIRGHFFEKIDGGALDKNLSNEMVLLNKLLMNKDKMGNTISAKFNASMEIEGKGVNGTKEGMGILAQIFSGNFNKDGESKEKELAEKNENALEIDFEEDINVEKEKVYAKSSNE